MTKTRSEIQKEINYKNLPLIQSYVSEGGKILPRRLTSFSAKEQRSLAKAVKLARFIAIMAPVNK